MAKRNTCDARAGMCVGVGERVRGCGCVAGMCVGVGERVWVCCARKKKGRSHRNKSESVRVSVRVSERVSVSVSVSVRVRE